MADLNRSFLAKVVLCLIVGTLVGALANMQFNKQYRELAVQEASNQLTLTRSFMETYSELIEDSGEQDHVVVPARFRAQAISRFSTITDTESDLKLLMVGVPGKYIQTPPADENMVTRIADMRRTRATKRTTEDFEYAQQKYLRTFAPALATSRSCVDCHNRIQDNEHNWQVGDLMGALIIDKNITAQTVYFKKLAFLIGLAVTAILSLLAHIHGLNGVLKQESKKFMKESEQDTITGCLNRRALFKYSKQLLQRFPGTCSVMMLDVDSFGDINEQHGYHAANEILSELANVIKNSVRRNDLLARTNGAKFILFVPKTNQEIAEAIAQRISKKVREYNFIIGGAVIPVTLSIGGMISEYDASFDLEARISDANSSLSDAKQAGRSRVVFPTRVIMDS